MTERVNSYRRDQMRKRLAALGEPCAICGHPIDYSLDWWIDPKDGKRKRHPYSFEWDHRVPLARGGDNSFENAQPTHRRCNQIKNDERRKRAEKPSEPIVCSRAW